MKNPNLHRPWQLLMAAFLIPLLAFLLACGPGAEPTPTATAIPTTTPTAAPLATPTPTRVLATPTPTSVAISTPTPTPGEQPKRGGVLRLSGGDQTIYDAHNIGAGGAPLLASLASGILINYVGDVVACDICREWHLENNGKTMVFTMFQGIKFSDGREMTSADVAYSINKMIGQIDGLVSPRCGTLKEYIDTIQTPSRYEVRINLVRPSAFVPKLLSVSQCAIYPDGTTRQDLQSKPFGSGPFLLKSFITGSEYKLERNPNYFKPGQPYLDGKTYLVTGSEAATIAAFLTGKIDYTGARRPSAQYLPQLHKLRDDGRVNFNRAITGTLPTGVYLNHAKPPFSDIRMRKAVILTLDRVGWTANVYDGDAAPQLLFPSGTEFGRPESELWNVVPGWGTGAKKQQEREESKKLLADAGYPNGIDLKQLAPQVSTGASYRWTEVSRQDLAAVGIRTTLENTDSITFTNRQQNLDYLLVAWGNSLQTMDPDESLGGAFITGGARNVLGYSNPALDKLYVQMSSELDPTKRRQLVRQMEDIIVLQDWAMGMMTGPIDENFWWKRVKNFTFGMSTLFASGQYRADRIWIEE